MATTYAWKGSKEAFIAEAKSHGWGKGKDGNGNFCLIHENGNYCHDVSEWEINGEPVTGFTRYGRNLSVDELASEIGAVSEYEDEFNHLIGNGE